MLTFILAVLGTALGIGVIVGLFTLVFIIAFKLFDVSYILGIVFLLIGGSFILVGLEYLGQVLGV